MLFGQDREQLRRMYAEAWRKHRESVPMTPLEDQIAAVIERHPEYHAALTGPGLERDYAPEDGATNPFLHMGLHLAVREQVATDRPPGIRAVFAKLRSAAGDEHAAEHRMLECLAEALWRAQRDGTAPDEQSYLESLRRLT